MPNRIFLAVVFFAISHLLNAQSNDFRPVRARDFSKTALSNEQDYDALVLFRKHYSYFSSDHQDFSNNTIVHERILINNDDGLRYATQMISLYKGEKDSDKVTDITGTTYNLVNNNSKSQKYSIRHLFLYLIMAFSEGQFSLRLYQRLK